MRVVVASGHLTDEPGRNPPRFPEDSVGRVRMEIRRQLKWWGMTSGDLLICGGGRGGDLLAAEEALATGADVRLCLALPPQEFVRRSVYVSGTDWVDRFRSVEAASDVEVQDSLLKGGGNVFEAANERMVGLGCAVAASERHALVVWNGDGGDRRGGTAHLAERAAAAGIPVFGIDPTPRGAADRQWAPGRKRLLALDGGGIRGVLSLGILQSLERQLRDLTGRPGLVLADYFDYIGGTSTGAVIATALSLGKPVKEVLDLYRELGARVFRWNWLTPFVSLHRTTPLMREVDALVGGDRTLGDPQLRTLLLLMLHNSDTDSPWPLSNCPSARYNRPERNLTSHPDRGTPHYPDRNLDIPLRLLVRGSTAAPLYFAPQDIEVGRRTVRFQDGGVTPYNNPAMLLFSMATQREYHVQWTVGEDKILLVSVGTGLAAARQGKRWSSAGRIKHLPAVFMNGASIGQDYLCRTEGTTAYGLPIDNEVGRVPKGRGLFTYARYNVDIGNLKELRAELVAAGVGASELEELRAIERIDRRQLVKLNARRHIDALYTLGRLAGRLVNVQAHFPGFLPV